jgi:hypothetical protein
MTSQTSFLFPRVMRSAVPKIAITVGLLFFGADQAKAQTGALAFSDGTNNWASQFLDGTGSPFLPVSFDVTFDPAGVNLISGADGLFLPDFKAVPPSLPYVTGTNSPAVTFAFESSAPGVAYYSLAEDLVFTFGGPDSAGVFTIYSGTVFGGTVDPSFSNVQFDIDVAKTLELNPATTSPTVTGLVNDPVEIFGGAFTFNDTIGPAPGSYSAQVDIRKQSTSVPLPLPIFGAAVALGYSRKIRARVKMSTTC